MILNKEQIIARELISTNVNPDCFMDASYDLTVGTIVTPDGNTGNSSYALRPQGIVKVISNEEFALPKDITGFVHVKTALCNEGVLALNIGIVDPCYSGPLQSALLNFGKVKHRIQVGDVFGRITFHLSEATKDDPSDTNRAVHLKRLQISPVSAQSNAQRDVDKFLAADFLDFNNTVKEAAKKATSEYRNTLLWYAPVLALLLAIFTYLLNFANMNRMENYLSIKDRVSDATQLDQLRKDVQGISEAQKLIEQELAERDKRFRASKSGPTVNQPANDK